MSITEPAIHVSFTSSRPAARLRKHIVSVISWLWTWHRNRRAIKDMSQMEDWQLYDIGLQRSDIEDFPTSHFFDDGTHHFVKITRNRGNRF